MSSPVVRLTIRGVLARKFRVLLTAFAIVLGVAFVSGAFMLTDSVKGAINGLFDELQGDVDLEVRARIAFGDEATAQRDPVPDSLVADIAKVEGVRTVEVNILRQATIIKKNGKPLQTSGPSFGIAWYGTEGLDGRLVLEGREARGAGEVAIDKKSAERAGYALGETVPIVGPNGSADFTLVGLTGTKTTEGGGGASVSAFDPATADEFLGTDGRVDSIFIGLAAGASQGAVQDAVAAAIGADASGSPYEVITGDQSAKETAGAINDIIDIFGKVLLGFAAISLFVSAFLIFNTFAIIVSQRLRELALLRAIGADIRQIRMMILGESGIIGLLATALGIAGGVLVSKGITALFNATGAAFPSASTVISARTIAVSLLVGVGVTLLAAFVPAARAGRIPPVAAMRPEVGFSSLQRNKRLVVATTTLVVGIVLFVVGLFAQPGGTVGILLAGAVGAVMIFLGVASLSQSVAAPVSRIVSNILPFPGRSMNRKTPGRIASRNAQRQPRRTASTASALMIGLALVSTIAVVAASVQATLRKALGTSITADFYVTNSGFQGLPVAFADKLAQLPELGAVSPFRAANAQVEGESKSIGAVDPSMGELVDADIQSGSFDSIADGAVLLHKDPARDLGVSVGDTIKMTWQNGKVTALQVGAIYGDSSIVGNWLVSLDTLNAASSAPPLDFFIGAKIADGVDADVARAAVEAVATEFPSAEVQDRVEFQQSQEDQLNQLLFIVYSLLVFAIAIAVLGIANTMALSVFERTREFGLLRAVGMTRRQLKRSVRWEAIIVSVFGATLGVVVGVPLGMAVATALPETFVSTLQIPFGTIVTILLASIVVGIIAAIGPARRAAKLDILHAITTV
jgi:putative ABC transport system permease protein